MAFLMLDAAAEGLTEDIFLIFDLIRSFLPYSLPYQHSY